MLIEPFCIFNSCPIEISKAEKGINKNKYQQAFNFHTPFKKPKYLSLKLDDNYLFDDEKISNLNYPFLSSNLFNKNNLNTFILSSQNSSKNNKDESKNDNLSSNNSQTKKKSLSKDISNSNNKEITNDETYINISKDIYEEEDNKNSKELNMSNITNKNNNKNKIKTNSNNKELNHIKESLELCDDKYKLNLNEYIEQNIETDKEEINENFDENILSLICNYSDNNINSKDSLFNEIKEKNKMDIDFNDDNF